MDALPGIYAEALRLRDEGLDDPSIAQRLEIDVASVRPLLRLAEAKLARTQVPETDHRRRSAAADDGRQPNQ